MCPINFLWEETYTPTMHSASLTLAHNALHSPSYYTLEDNCHAHARTTSACADDGLCYFMLSKLPLNNNLSNNSQKIRTTISANIIISLKKTTIIISQST